jgi:hypothetical protein
MKAPVVSRSTKVIAGALAAPFAILVVLGLIILGREALPGVLFLTGLVIVPISAAVWLGIGAGRATDLRLKRRRRPLARLPKGITGVEDRDLRPDVDRSSTVLATTGEPLVAG